MSRITETFGRLRRAGRTALMPFLTMGYPERESALDLIPVIVEAGADMVELGVPFSDPLADGATIQASSQRALQNGTTLHRCLEQAERLRYEGISVPFILMSYYNPIFQMGLERFAERAAGAGIDGCIIPDLPPEESDALRAPLSKEGIDIIFLLAPTSDLDRIQLVADRSSGFLYLVSLTGVTGARDSVSTDLQDFSTRVRDVTDMPLAVGFGISTPDQAGRVAQIADGVIVGSALLDAIGRHQDGVGAAHDFITGLRAAIDGAG